MASARACLIALIALGTLGCGADATASSGYALDSLAQGPLGPASAYPEAALVDSTVGYCSGAVIAPRVVLTAGHCVDGGGPWTVTTPYNLDRNGLPERRTADRVWTRYTNQDTLVDPTLPDVGLILFDAEEAFHLPEYPTLAKESVPQGSFVNCIGRKDRGELHSNALFLSESVAVRPSKRFPMSYRSQAVIEQGDSGGPALLEGTHEIIAVNSGVMDQHAAALFSAGDTSITGRDPVRLQVLARVDLVLAEILANIAQNGGLAEADE